MNFDNNTPIYLQIIRIIKLDIIKGEYKPGDKLLSVRTLALKYKVNPNTIAKALNILEDEGLIYTERTNGKFVTKDEKKIKNVKIEMAINLTNSYLKDMENLGISFKETKKYIEGRYDDGTIRM